MTLIRGKLRDESLKTPPAPVEERVSLHLYLHDCIIHTRDSPLYLLFKFI